jgi:hypothetical protein
MKTLKNSFVTIAVVLSTALITPTFAEEAKAKDATASPQMSDAEMMAKMTELSKLNENHKLLAQLAGTWTYNVKMWMAPDAPPMDSKGSAVRKPIMEGRYFVANFTGEMKMPGEGGKMKNFEFKGMSIEGYDNVQQKFVSTWCDNMSTGIMTSAGTYDSTTKELIQMEMPFFTASEVTTLKIDKGWVTEASVEDVKLLPGVHRTMYRPEGGRYAAALTARDRAVLVLGREGGALVSPDDREALLALVNPDV